MRNSIIITLLYAFSLCSYSMAAEPMGKENIYVVQSCNIPQSIAIKEIPFAPGPTLQEVQKIKHEVEADKFKYLKPLRKIDLSKYSSLTSRMQMGVNGEYGNQFTSYGSFERHMLIDVQDFPSTPDNPMVWVDLAAGCGAFAIRVFEHIRNTSQARLVVNDILSGNLQNLVALIIESIKHKKNDGLGSCISVFPGDCLTICENPAFMKTIPDGADFVSALNVIHYFSPYKVVNFFAQMSDILKVGGKLNLMHDLPLTYTVDPDLEEKVFKPLKNKELFQENPSLAAALLSLTLSSPNMAFYYITVQLRFISECLQKRNLEFPQYRNRNLLNGVLKSPTDIFTPAPEFIEEVSQIVGFKLIKKVPLSRCHYNSGDLEWNDVDEENASSMGYIFKKEANVTNFRESAAFKELIERTKRADNQRVGIRFKAVSWYPFIEEIK